MGCVWVIILVSSCLAAFMMSLIFLRGPSEHCQSLDYIQRVDGGSGDEEEELLETAVILTEEDVEALKEFFLTPTDVIDFLKHL